MNRPAIYFLLILLQIPGIGSSCAAFANSPDRQALEAQVTQLTSRVQTLEAKLDHLLTRLEGQQETPATKDIQAAVSGKRELPKPSLAIGGHVKVDLIANSVSVGGPGGSNFADGALFPFAIPLDDFGETDQLTANARASRFWVNASTPTRLGDLGAYLEFDFASLDGSGNERISNSYNARIRHAYATFRNFTLGQTYTSFLNIFAYPELNEGNGPIGILNIRQPMVRYQRQMDRWSWTLSAEQPETTITDLTGARLTIDDDRMPDLVARVDWQAELSSWSLAAITRKIRIDDVISDSATAAGISASGRIYTSGANNFRFALTYGRGIGRYVSYNSFNDALITDDGELDLIPVRAGFAAYQHWWSDKWRSNIAFGYGAADIKKRYTVSTVDESYRSAHLNLMWSPIPAATFGLEWVHGKRELVDGRDADINRLQFTSLYKFRN